MEALLAGRVPHLKFDSFAAEKNRLDFKVDADGGNEGSVECVIWKIRPSGQQCLLDGIIA